MIPKEIIQENYEGLSYKEVTELRMKEKDEEIKQVLKETILIYKQALEEKDIFYKQALEEKDKEIEKLKLQLSNQK